MAEHMKTRNEIRDAFLSALDGNYHAKELVRSTGMLEDEAKQIEALWIELRAEQDRERIGN